MIDGTGDSACERLWITAGLAEAHCAPELGVPVVHTFHETEHAGDVDGVEHVLGVGAWEPLESPYEQSRVLDDHRTTELVGHVPCTVQSDVLDRRAADLRIVDGDPLDLPAQYGQDTTGLGDLVLVRCSELYPHPVRLAARKDLSVWSGRARVG